MTTDDLFGWGGFVLNVWGNWALTRQDRKGWIIRFVCNAVWILYSLQTNSWPLLVNHITFAGINAIGYRRWKRERTEKP